MRVEEQPTVNNSPPSTAHTPIPRKPNVAFMHDLRFAASYRARRWEVQKDWMKRDPPLSLPGEEKRCASCLFDHTAAIAATGAWVARLRISTARASTSSLTFDGTVNATVRSNRSSLCGHEPLA